MTTPLRRLYGGSNRKHHLRLSAHIAGALMALSATNPGVTVMGLWLQMPHSALWLVAGVACYGHELWATADRDEEEKRKPQGFTHWYWLPYGLALNHRVLLSHGFIVGTIARVLYGWWPALIGLGLLWQVSPFWAAWIGVAIGVGWMANDLGHLALDL